MEFSKKGGGEYSGTSERIKCYHRLVNAIKDTDTRLAKSQTYEVQLWGQWERWTWSKEKEDFEVYKTTGWHFLGAFRLSATGQDRKKSAYLRKTRKSTILKEKGRSSPLCWKGWAVKPWLARNYILGEREPYRIR